MKQIIFILLSIVCFCSCSKDDVYSEVLPETTEIVVNYDCPAEGVCSGCRVHYNILQGNFVYNTETQVVKIYTRNGVVELNKYQVRDLYDVIMRLKNNEGGNQSLINIIDNDNSTTSAIHCIHWLYNDYQINSDFIELLYDKIRN